MRSRFSLRWRRSWVWPCVRLKHMCLMRFWKCYRKRSWSLHVVVCATQMLKTLAISVWVPFIAARDTSIQATALTSKYATSSDDRSDRIWVCFLAMVWMKRSPTDVANAICRTQVSRVPVVIKPSTVRRSANWKLKFYIKDSVLCSKSLRRAKRRFIPLPALLCSSEMGSCKLIFMHFESKTNPIFLGIVNSARNISSWNLIKQLLPSKFNRSSIIRFLKSQLIRRRRQGSANQRNVDKSFKQSSNRMMACVTTMLTMKSQRVKLIWTRK